MIKDPAVTFWRWIGSVLAWAVYLFLLLPTLIVIPIAFGESTEVQFPPAGFSLDLFRRFFTDQVWMSSLWTSTQIAVSAAFLALVIGVPAAYGLARAPIRARPVVQLALMSPLLIPSIVLALGVYLYFGRAGIAGTKTAIILAHTAYVLPFVVLTASSGLKALDSQIELAAQVLGSSRLQVLRHVVIPQMRPAIMVSLLFAFLMSFDEVVLAWFLSSTSATTLPVKMFTAIHWEVSPVLAAVATMLTFISAMACVAAAILQRKAPR